MSIGLSTSLSRGAVTRSFVSAEHAAALLCLAAAFSVTLAVHLVQPQPILWPAAVALLPMIAALVLLDRHRTLLTSLVYLLVGVVGVSVYTAFHAQMTWLPDALESAVLAFPVLAVILVGGPGRRPAQIAGWCTVAFALAVAASLAARQVVGVPSTVDVLVIFAYPVSLIILLLARAAARGTEATWAGLRRAAREDALFVMRVREEARATAVIHDTVLNHLAVVAAAPSGPLSDDLRAQVEHDIAALDADDWLDDRPDRARDGRWSDDDSSPGLQDALAAALALGLRVDVTGRSSDLRLLSHEQDGALGLALTQCLVNVQRHSGVREAELAIGAVGGQLVAMVIDTGRGFDPDDVAADRMGIRNSIRSRIEAVGGSVSVWSSPGCGTSVVIRFPTAADPAAGVDTHAEAASPARPAADPGFSEGDG